MLVLGIAGCTTPVRVTPVDPDRVHRALTSNVLSTGEISQHTRNVLFAHDLSDLFEQRPATAIAALHGIAISREARRRDIFALAELSFFHAERSGERSHYFAAIVYAYAFLFPTERDRAPSPYDPRLRIACDLYNRALTSALASPNRRTVELRGGEYRLPFGTLTIDFDDDSLIVGDRRMVRFVPLADLQVTGLESRYRWPGIGAPLAASSVALDPKRELDDFVQPWAKVARSAVLQFEDVDGQLRSGQLHAGLELFIPGTTESVTIGGEAVPIEVEASATLAYTLAESPVWAQELRGFLQGVGVIDETSRLAALAPHQRGKIPVVLVHGTASSAGRWAQMLNELVNDSRIRSHYEFWLFTYNTGNPVAYSALQLRQALERAIVRLDSDGSDAALRQMVVIGHSQGGLLAKMTAIDSGTRFFETVSRLPLDQLVLAKRERELIQKMMFVTPVTAVSRVIFIATPQHGSYFAGNIASHLLARFITLPADVINLTTNLVKNNQKALAFAAVGQVPTAVDNMTPGEPFIKTLADIPLAPGVQAHSIIPALGAGPLAERDDGIVEYSSAHIEGVESELVVATGHSCQAHPIVIQEVRRILLSHLGE